MNINKKDIVYDVGVRSFIEGPETDTQCIASFCILFLSQCSKCHYYFWSLRYFLKVVMRNSKLISTPTERLSFVSPAKSDA